MRKFLMVMVVALVAAIGFAGPAQAAVNAVTMPFGMAYGNSTTSGTINFTDGYTATVSGSVHAASGSRIVCFWGANGAMQTDVKCSPRAFVDGPDRSFSEPLTLAVSGGVQRVYIGMYDENDTPRAGEFCTRLGCTRQF